jgi:hypothetical protein
VTKQTRRRSFQAITGISIAGFIALLAVNLKPILDALTGLPVILMKFSEVLPLGTSTFFMVLMISGFCWVWAKRVNQHDFAAESIALGIAVALMVATSLILPPPNDLSSAAAMLQAIMLGLLCGFSSPYVFKGITLAGRWMWSMTAGDDDEADPDA